MGFITTQKIVICSPLKDETIDYQYNKQKESKFSNFFMADIVIENLKCIALDRTQKICDKIVTTFSKEVLSNMFYVHMCFCM